MLGAWVPVYRSCSTVLWQWKLHNYVVERTGHFLLVKFSYLGIDDWELPLPIMLMMLLVPESNNTCWARLNHVGAGTAWFQKVMIFCFACWAFGYLVYRSCSTFLWHRKLHNDLITDHFVVLNVDNLALMIESSLFRSCCWCCSFRNQITLCFPRQVGDRKTPGWGEGTSQAWSLGKK